MFQIYTDVAMLDALAAKPGAAPGAPSRWVKIAPRGRFTTRDNRTFEVDPEALARRFAKDGVDLAVDMDHATAKKTLFGEIAPAVGWIGKVEARTDGLYGFVEWLAEGARILAARTHRYLSPTLQANAAGVVNWVHSVSLVAAPALPNMPALASAGVTDTAKHQPLETLGTSGMTRIITPDILSAIFRGFKTSFQQAFEGAKSYRSVVAMETKSSTAEEAYGWFGTFPELREWIGARHVHGLKTHGFAIKNRLFESTVAVARTDIEDDKVGLYAPMFQEMGRKSKEHPDKLLFELLAVGFSTNCYDGQSFFDVDHPVGTEGNVISVPNMLAGAGEPWFLLDCSRAVKPLVWQERTPYVITQLDNDRDDSVFWRDEYVYGIRARANCGYGLWQLALGSKAALTSENLREAWSRMVNFTDDNGNRLGVRPTHIVVGIANFFTARDLILPDVVAGTTNTNRNLVEIIAPPQL